jgi:hypothetical protein
MEGWGQANNQTPYPGQGMQPGQPGSSGPMPQPIPGQSGPASNYWGYGQQQQQQQQPQPQPQQPQQQPPQGYPMPGAQGVYPGYGQPPANGPQTGTVNPMAPGGSGSSSQQSGSWCGVSLEERAKASARMNEEIVEKLKVHVEKISLNEPTVKTHVIELGCNLNPDNAAFRKNSIKISADETMLASLLPDKMEGKSFSLENFIMHEFVLESFCNDASDHCYLQSDMVKPERINYNGDHSLAWLYQTAHADRNHVLFKANSFKDAGFISAFPGWNPQRMREAGVRHFGDRVVITAENAMVQQILRTTQDPATLENILQTSVDFPGHFIMNTNTFDQFCNVMETAYDKLIPVRNLHACLNVTFKTASGGPLIPVGAKLDPTKPPPRLSATFLLTGSPN